MAKRIRKNTNTKKVVYRGIAVGMAAVMGGVPVSAASGETRKEETVYVNADASGNATDVTVSNWLKNSSGDAAIKDKSDLQDIENVKGDETYSGSGDSMSWQADGSDIYYQGKTDKELPVSVQFKYFLNGVQMQPSELVGKSGKLKIQADYQNKAKTTTKIDGRTESVYNPFVMVTGMILSDEHFSNIVIDNGKVISDGSRNIVIGVAMPGLKDSLNISKDQAKNVTLPESLEITADVTDFQMDSTFTVAMSDVLKELDVDGIADTDELTDALDELEDAALKLVDGSSELSDGANTLKDKYTEFNDGVRTLKDGISQLNGGAKTLDSAVGAYTKGAEELNKGIQKYLGSKGVMTGKVTEYKNGVNSVVSGVKTYTKGTTTLADGVISYVEGEQKLAEGAKALQPLTTGLSQISAAIDQMYAALDGEGSTQEDLKAASSALAAGTQQLQSALDGMSGLTSQIDDLAQSGSDLITQGKALSSAVDSSIKTPAAQLMADGQTLAAQLTTISTTLSDLQTQAQNAIQTAMGSTVQNVNGQIDDRNSKLNAARSAISSAADTANGQINAANGQIDSARSALDAAIAAADAAGNTELVSSLQSAKANLPTVSKVDTTVSADTSAAGALDQISAPQISADMPNIDTAALTQTLTSMGSSLQTLQNAAAAMSTQLDSMQTRLSGITSVDIPEAPMAQLKGSVAALNTGMQGLDAGIGALSGNVRTLQTQTASLPTAGKGIESLLGGFDALNAYNESLTSGAKELKQNAPVLDKGVETLQSGTKQLAKGVSQLSGQLSKGASTLVSNNAALNKGTGTLLDGVDELFTGAGTLQSASGQVADGITQLADGAKELADGASEFEEDGTKKLKDTVEDDLMSVIDRIKALSSSDCTYDTFSGKADGVDSNVKFIIETDPIE